jgi:signal transduction histidine kinase
MTLVHALPCRVWLSDALPPAWRERVALELRDVAEVRVLGQGRVWHGPAIVVLRNTDVSEDRDSVTRILDAAAPGRPIVVGGTNDRDLLLTALNELHALRVLRPEAPPAEAAEAVRAAHARLELDAMVSLQIQRLELETERLDRTLAEVDDVHHEFLHAERLSTIGRLFGGLLGSVRRHVDVMEVLEQQALAVELPDEAFKLLHNVSESSRTILGLLDELERFARGTADGPKRRAAESVGAIVRQVHEFARYDELSRGRRLLLHIDTDATVYADRYGLYQVLLNLVRNALQATKEGGLVELNARRDGAEALIEVIDNGAGVSPELRARLFDGFVSTKGDEGTGLGLQNSRRVVERHGGTLRYFDRVGDGSRFVVRLPIHDAP